MLGRDFGEAEWTLQLRLGKGTLDYLVGALCFVTQRRDANPRCPPVARSHGCLQAEVGLLGPCQVRAALVGKSLALEAGSLLGLVRLWGAAHPGSQGLRHSLL